MERCVKPELLDELPPADARARRSREDLVRVNAWMGNSDAMARALQATCNGGTGRRMVELGAGDGRFLLGVARRLPGGWRGTHVLLLDRLKAALPEICQGFGALGWRAEILEAEAVAWLAQRDTLVCEVMVANLFLHHFPPVQLAALLSAAAKRTRIFIAVEPRRSRRSLLFSHLLWFIGCNRVTRHDAPVSVRAGFTGCELSRLWPTDRGWSLRETAAGRFNQLFIAERRE